LDKETARRKEKGRKGGGAGSDGLAVLIGITPDSAIAARTLGGVETHVGCDHNVGVVAGFGGRAQAYTGSGQQARRDVAPVDVAKRQAHILDYRDGRFSIAVRQKQDEFLAAETRGKAQFRHMRFEGARHAAQDVVANEV
jgi:hypothetical protein